jgi:Na+/proline symporter
MFGLHPYDVIVIATYLLLTAGIGLYVARRVKDTTHYFMGSRNFGKLLMIGQSFGVGTQAEQPVGTAGKSYQLGYSGLWFGWKFIFCTPFYWLMAPIFRRLRVVTTASYMETRYGSGIGLLYSLYALVFLMIIMSAMQNGAAKVVSQATGAAITHGWVVWSMTIIFVIYSFVGGRVSAAFTDFFQSILIIVLSFIIVPFGLARLGGWSALKAALTPQQMSLAIPGGLTFGLIAVLSLQSLAAIGAQPHQMAAVGTGRTEFNCRVGFTYGNMIKRLCTIGWALVGLIVLAMVTRKMLPPLDEPESAFGVACQSLLGPGFLGLMVASVLATNMSTCSAMMVDLGALFVQNVYRPYFRPAAPDTHYLAVARVSGVGLTFASMGLVYVMPNVLDALLQSDSLAAFMGVPFLAGLIWKRANRAGAFCAFVVGTALNLTLNLAVTGNITQWRQDIFLLSFAGSLVGLVAGSLLTRPEPEAAWETLQTRLHTPVSADENATQMITPQALAAEANGEGLLLVDILHLPRTFSFRRYRNDLVGFAWALLVVIALLAVAFALLWT